MEGYAGLVTRCAESNFRGFNFVNGRETRETKSTAKHKTYNMVITCYRVSTPDNSLINTSHIKLESFQSPFHEKINSSLDV